MEMKRLKNCFYQFSDTPYMLRNDNIEGIKDVFNGMVENISEDRPTFLADFGKTNGVTKQSNVSITY
jgi:hypothetical protein